MRTLLPMALLACASSLHAQDDSAAPAVSEKPQPALIAPLAVKRTLIGVATADGGFVAVGDRGHVLRSPDGKEWTQVPAPVDVMLNRVRFQDGKTGFAVGHDATIIATHDAGATWTVAHFDSTSRPLYDVAFLDDTHFVAIGGYGTWLDSTDGGATWTPRDFPIGGLGQHFNAIAKLADGSWLVAGEKGLLMRSKDNGANWEMLDSPYTGSFFGVLPQGDKGALVFGLRGHVYVADDVGKCPPIKVDGYDPYTRETVTDPARLAKLGWRSVDLPTTESLFGGARNDVGAALLVGVNGTVIGLDAGATKAAAPRKPDGDTLAGVTFAKGRWMGVGRHGPVDLGDLTGSH